jgi:hypothetical protein
MSSKELRSRQHDEWAHLNYYTKVSKYDLDRGNIKMNSAQKEKNVRKVINARAKRN